MKLIFFGGGRTDLYEPALATEVPSVANGGISPDGKTYTFKIRTGAKFHDGNVITPDGVKYSLMRFMLTDQDGRSVRVQGVDPAMAVVRAVREVSRGRKRVFVGGLPGRGRAKGRTDSCDGMSSEGQNVNFCFLLCSTCWGTA